MQEAHSPESCMTRQEMPLLPWQHLGCLEGSPARERSPWAPWCHQCCQGTGLGSPTSGSPGPGQVVSWPRAVSAVTEAPTWVLSQAHCAASVAHPHSKWQGSLQFRSSSCVCAGGRVALQPPPRGLLPLCPLNLRSQLERG